MKDITVLSCFCTNIAKPIILSSQKDHLFQSSGESEIYTASMKQSLWLNCWTWGNASICKIDWATVFGNSLFYKTMRGVV